MTMHTIIIKYNIGVKTARAVVVRSVQLVESARTLLGRFYLARYSAAQGPRAENDNTGQARRAGRCMSRDAGDDVGRGSSRHKIGARWGCSAMLRVPADCLKL